MALVAGTGAASKRGLLIRNAEAVQTARELGAAILDKTGTLTEGAPKVVETNLTPELLNAAASIERSSTHPLAKAIAAAAAGDAEVSEVAETAGGLLLGAFFMATDYSTSPMTGKGQIIIGVADRKSVV